MFGTTFNSLHSYEDFGFRVTMRIIGTPSKIKVIERIPHSNQIFDFSTISGGQEYTERELTYRYNFDHENKIALDSNMTAFINHLFQPQNQVVFRDDNIPNYFFLAEVRDSIDDFERRFRKTLTVTYTCYPFRIADNIEGTDIWDTFNFLLDTAQDVLFHLDGNSQVCSLINAGAVITRPVITTTMDNVTIVTNNETFVLEKAGEHSMPDLVLFPGQNELTISSPNAGTVHFGFRRELI